MARYELPADGRAVTLHDCVITGIAVDGNLLELRFDGGVRLIPGTDVNPTDECLDTGPAVMRIRSVVPGDDIVILQRELRLFGKTILSLWKEVTVEKMARRVDKRQLEVITCLYDGVGMMLDGWVVAGCHSFGLCDSRFLWRIFALDTVFCFDVIRNA